MHSILMRFLCFALMLMLIPGIALAAEKFSPSDAKSAQQAALSLLEQVAYSAEYGSSRTGLIRWETPLRIYVGGKPTKADLATLNTFMIQMASRVPNMPNMTRVATASEANVTIYFVPLKQMKNYVTNYTEGNWGYVYYWYTNWKITKMEVAIATDVTDQKARNHLIMEELVNGMGLGNDHYAYSDSITYQNWTTVQQLSEVDWLMLNMIYHEDAYTGMTWSQFYQMTNRRINNR